MNGPDWTVHTYCRDPQISRGGGFEQQMGEFIFSIRSSGKLKTNVILVLYGVIFFLAETDF